MQTLRTHVAGIDVHKKMLAITTLCGSVDDEPVETQFNCETMTGHLIAAGQKLLDMGIKEAVMESTGIYWKCVYNVWKPMGISLTLAQAAHVKNVPGRKTDMNDSQWLARLHRHGLIRNSFIPEKVFQNLRTIVRYRGSLVNDLTRVKNRIQKVLEDGNVKWGSIVSDVFGKSGLNILSLIASGVTDPTTLSSAVTTRIKNKDKVAEALRNCLTQEHVYMIEELMIGYKHFQKRISSSEKKLANMVAPYRHLIDKLKEIPGIDEILAMGILAESSDDMTNFESTRHYAAWAGTASGNNESAGKKKRSKCRKGNPYLRMCLIQAANGAVKKKRSFYQSKYQRLRYRLGSANKAKVAIANRLARTVYEVLKGAPFKDLGYYRGCSPDEKKVERLCSKLRLLGMTVTYEKTEVLVSNKTTIVAETGECLA